MFSIRFRNNGTDCVERDKDIDSIKEILLGGTSINNQSIDKALHWCSNAYFGDVYTDRENQFIIQCYNPNNKIKRNIKRKDIYTNDEVIKIFKNAEKTHQECHMRVYDDGIWTVDIERHPYGVIRFWVAKEYKNGHYASTLCTVTPDGRYSADFKISKAAERKVISLYTKLINNNLL